MSGGDGPDRPRRRPGRRPGPSDTRERILGAARAAFAEAGFDGATIRSIAAAAGVDPALIHHYFGSKQRLFVAAMRLPVDPAAVAPGLLAGDPAGVGERLVRFVLGLWDEPSTRSSMVGIVRSAAADPVAAGMLRQILAEGPFAAIVRAVMAEEPYRSLVGPIGRPAAELRATLIGSQLVGLLMARSVVAVEPLASTPAETIVAAVGPTIQRYLVGDLG
ncbi:MAG: TetR family transcriptional regulator [Chloroflexi bacterium]|nr:TetR family transcriptional regulator [Chloroflexota bacterium]